MSKIALGIGATGLTVGAGLGVTTYLSQDKSLSVRLIKEGFDVKVTNWDAIFTIYEKEPTHLFKLNDGEKKDKATLQKKCSEVLSQKSTSEENYKLAKRWCVKEEAVSDILNRLNLRPLKTSTNEDDNNHWKGIVAKVKDVPKELGVLETAEVNANVSKIKENCGKIIAVKTTAKEFDSKFELAKNWCSLKP